MTPPFGPAVVVDEVGKTFGRTRALDGISFTAGSGVTGLLGPNGAGKTTALRMLATVLGPDRGRLRLLGRNPADAGDRLEIRRRLGYLPQEPGFHRGFTAFEFVDYVAILKEMTNRRERHDEVRRVLDVVGLSAVSGKKIRALSGGMRRRVGLAQALLGDPDLLVLDEPTVGLDPEQRLRFRELISRAAEGRCVILSTHQTEDVAALCNAIVVVQAGRTLFRGTPAQLVETAAGRVWLDDVRSPDAHLAWRTGTGQHRNIGEVSPSGAQLVQPTVEDAYLLLLGDESVAVPA
ncbi:MAG: ABC transporter ATP-binding protein [Actinomycetota bacterium]|nr:ABC transporter ATP-binding protein [Actinomycetota bacterium]